MPNRSALNLECVFALKKNWPVIFAVALDVTLISDLYGIQKVICLAQLNSTSQKMTKAEHNRPILKLFYNRPLALAVEVFCKTIGLVIYIQNIPIIVSFSLLLS